MKELPEYLQKIYDENKNELVIGEDMRVKKLVGIAEDEIDYLYVYDNGNDIELWSVMGGMIPLKDKLDLSDYMYMMKYYNIDNVKELIGDEAVLLV